MDTEKKFNLKKGNAIGLFIVFLLIGFCLVSMVFDIVQMFKNKEEHIAMQVIDIVIYVGIVFYAVYGYKIPHGNLFKYIMLCFAVLKLINVSCAAEVNVPVAICMVIGCSGIIYISGRLDRFKQNTIISIFVFALFIAIGILCLFFMTKGPGSVISPVEEVIPSNLGQEGAYNTLHTIIKSFNPAIQWAAIALAYITRYHLHKEAGLVDKK